MKDPWSIKTVKLRYFMGEIHLFSVDFPLMVLDTHFTMLASDLSKTLLSPEDLPSTVQGALIRSHPIKTSPIRLIWLSGLIRYIPSEYERYYIDLQASFADYLKKFSSKSRSTLKRKLKKFASASGGEICWREFRKYEEIREFYQLARGVSRMTYQERLLDSGLPNNEAFRKQMLDLAPKGLVRGYLLFLAKRPVAYLYCPIKDGVFLYQYVGYDPEFRNLSPGTVLQYLVLEKLFCEAGPQMFDFTEGEGEHKRFYATGSVRCADVYYFRATAKNLLFIGLHYVVNVLSRNIVRILESIRLKNRVKRFFRSHS